MHVKMKGGNTLLLGPAGAVARRRMDRLGLALLKEKVSRQHELLCGNGMLAADNTEFRNQLAAMRLQIESLREQNTALEAELQVRERACSNVP